MAQKNNNASAQAGRNDDQVDWPPALKTLRQAAIQALKRANAIPSSPGDRGEHDDLFTMMRAMADPKNTLAVYVAMAVAAGTVKGRPPSAAELQEHAELCRGFGQASLTDEERQAVERLARKGPRSV